MFVVAESTDGKQPVRGAGGAPLARRRRPGQRVAERLFEWRRERERAGVPLVGRKRESERECLEQCVATGAGDLWKRDDHVIARSRDRLTAEQLEADRR